MTNTAEQQLSELLNDSAEALDISEALDRRLTGAYTALGSWIKVDNAERYTTDSEVYPQGSRRLGTLTASTTPDKDCDIDLVYLRGLKRTSVSQQELKEQAGEQLARYVRNLERHGLDVPRLTEGCRCWTLHYSGFHLDVLPALLDDSINGHSARILQDAIIITDRDLRLWQSSNPKGYARWFRKRMEMALNEQRVRLAKSAGVTVESIPAYSARLEHRVRQDLSRRSG